MPNQIADRPDFTKMVNGYDGEIRFADEHVGQLLEVLSGLGVLEETAVIVSSDHGEAMGEHGVYGDHVCADEVVHNIPMIIKWPGVKTSPGQRDGFLYNVDLPPTLCELLGLRIPSGWDGRSFASALGDEGWHGRPFLVWDHSLYSCQRAVRTPDWLYVRTYHPGLFSFDDAMQEWVRFNLPQDGDLVDPMIEVIQSGPWRYVQPDQWITRLRNRSRGAAADEIVNRLSSLQVSRDPSN